MSFNFAQKTRATTRKQGVEARTKFSDLGTRQSHIIGTILEVTGDTYTVGIGYEPGVIIDDPDNPEEQIQKPPIATFTRVYAVPHADLSKDSLVWLVFMPGAQGQQPVIQTSGGGGATSCAITVNAFGVHFG